MHSLFLPCSLLALWTAWCSQLGPDLVACLGYCPVSKCDRSRSLTSTCRGLVISYSSWSFCYHEKQPCQATRLMRNTWTGNSIDLADNLQTIHKWGQDEVSSHQTIMQEKAQQMHSASPIPNNCQKSLQNYDLTKWLKF